MTKMRQLMRVWKIFVRKEAVKEFTIFSDEVSKASFAQRV